MNTITNPADRVVQAIFLRAHISLLNLGMKHSTLKKKDVIEKINITLGTQFSKNQGKEAETAIRHFILIHSQNKEG